MRSIWKMASIYESLVRSGGEAVFGSRQELRDSQAKWHFSPFAFRLCSFGIPENRQRNSASHCPIWLLIQVCFLQLELWLLVYESSSAVPVHWRLTRGPVKIVDENPPPGSLRVKTRLLSNWHHINSSVFKETSSSASSLIHIMPNKAPFVHI